MEIFRIFITTTCNNHKNMRRLDVRNIQAPLWPYASRAVSMALTRLSLQGFVVAEAPSSLPDTQPCACKMDRFCSAPGNTMTAPWDTWKRGFEAFLSSKQHQNGNGIGTYCLGKRQKRLLSTRHGELEQKRAAQ